MVQRIYKSANIAVRNIFKGELARRHTAGIFYVCTPIYGVAPVWRLNGPTALEVLRNGSAASFFFAAIQTIESVMRNTETTCLAGNNSTQQATDCPRKGLPELTHLVGEIRFWGQDALEFKRIIHEMFLEALPGQDDLRTSEQLGDFVWCYRELNHLLGLLEELQDFHSQLRIMKETFADCSTKANLIANN